MPVEPFAALPTCPSLTTGAIRLARSDERAPAATAAPLSPAQLMSGLWADARLRVYAMALGSRIADLAERLAQAAVSTTTA